MIEIEDMFVRQGATRSAIFCATRAASWLAGSLSSRKSSGRRQSRGSSCASGTVGGQTSTRPGQIALQRRMAHPNIVGDEASLMFGCTRRLRRPSRAPPARNETRLSTRHVQNSGRRRRAARNGCAFHGTYAAPRPGRRRSTVFHRRPRKRCADRSGFRGPRQIPP